MEITEFAGVKERATANGAMLEPDMGLVGINHPDHRTAATGAKNTVDFVPDLAAFRRSNVYALGALQLEQFPFFKLIKPKALAIGATVDLEISELNLDHGRNTFGADHRNMN